MERSLLRKTMVMFVSILLLVMPAIVTAQTAPPSAPQAEKTTKPAPPIAPAGRIGSGDGR